MTEAVVLQPAFVYTRVSTERQTLENQRIQIERFAQSHGYSIDPESWYQDEAVSGTIAPRQRDGFRDLIESLEAMKANGEALPKCVLVYEVSRLGRNFWDILDVVRALEDVCPIISTSPKEAFLQTPDRSLRQIFLSILAWVAERERENLIQRIGEGLVRSKIEKRHSGEIPSGYRQHICEKLGHNRCENSGKLYLDERGKIAYDLLKLNQDLRAVELQNHLGIGYKEAWNLLKSIKRFGYLAMPPPPSSTNSP